MFVFQIEKVPQPRPTRLSGSQIFEMKSGAAYGEIAASMRTYGVDANEKLHAKLDALNRAMNQLAQKPKYKAIAVEALDLLKKIDLTIPFSEAMEKFFVFINNKIGKTSLFTSLEKEIMPERQSILKSHGVDAKFNQMDLKEHAYAEMAATTYVYVVTSFALEPLHRSDPKLYNSFMDESIDIVYGGLKAAAKETNRQIQMANSPAPVKSDASKPVSSNDPAIIGMAAVAMVEEYAMNYYFQSPEDKKKNAPMDNYGDILKEVNEVRKILFGAHETFFSMSGVNQGAAFIAHRSKSQAAKEGEKRITEGQDKEKSAYASRLYSQTEEIREQRKEQDKTEKTREKKAKKSRSPTDYQREYEFKGPGVT